MSTTGRAVPKRPIGNVSVASVSCDRNTHSIASSTSDHTQRCSVPLLPRRTHINSTLHRHTQAAHIKHSSVRNSARTQAAMLCAHKQLDKRANNVHARQRMIEHGPQRTLTVTRPATGGCTKTAACSHKGHMATAAAAQHSSSTTASARRDTEREGCVGVRHRAMTQRRRQPKSHTTEPA